MLRRSTKTIVATAGIVAVLGTGIAVAADSTPCPCGNTPQTNAVSRPNGDGTQQRLRKRDGTGPRHAQRAGSRAGRGAANRGANCPYRS